MHHSTPLSSPIAGKVPHIVYAVLRQAEKQRRAGLLSEKAFEATLKRLSVEELSPRSLNLIVQQSSDGATRFLVESGSGERCELNEQPIRMLEDIQKRRSAPQRESNLPSSTMVGGGRWQAAM